MINWKAFGLNFIQGIIANLVLGNLGSQLKAYPLERLEQWLIRFGKAFGPPGLRHFSELTAQEQQDLLARVPVLKTNHSDYPAPLRWVPRTLTTWLGPAPTYADILLGNVSGEPTAVLKPIPNPGEFYVLRGYMASTTAEQFHDRIGWRFDDVDQYHSLSVSVKLR